MAERRYWLFKSEPTAYSFTDLQNEEDRTAEWDGVRNYQVRNFMRDDMQVGDGVLFYHSTAKPLAVVGTATIVSGAYPDATAFDPTEKHYDAKSNPDNPAWLMVDIKADKEFVRPVTLAEIKQNPRLQDMFLVRRGMRLSIQPVTKDEWDEVTSLGGLLTHQSPRSQAARDYHEATKLTYINLRTKPPLYKTYQDIPKFPLPSEFPSPEMPALEAAGGIGTPAAASTPGLKAMAQLLFYSAGLVRKAFLPSVGEVHYRAAASAGALYPIDIYVVCEDIEELEAGVYHFSAADFSLGQLRKGDFRRELARLTGNDPEVAASPVSFVCTANLWRSAWKYRARGYRYCFWDCGTILSNLLAVSRSLGLPSRVSGGFVDADVDRLLGIDPQDEAGLCIVTLGSQTPGAPAPASPGSLVDITPPYNLAVSRIEYDEVTRAHADAALQTPEEVAAWRSTAFSPPLGQERRHEPGAGTPVSALSSTGYSDSPLGPVINDRASTRRFAREPVSLAQFHSVLSAATQPARWDFQDRGSLNDLYLIVNAVESLEPGAYFFSVENQELTPLRSGSFREHAAHLCFEQALGGDSSAVGFFMADLEDAFRRMGNRGYRAAQLEAGVMGGNMYLCAHSLGLGATGMTFFDDEVAEFFSPHAQGKSVMFLVGLGLPGHPNRVRPYRSQVAVQLDALARGAGTPPSGQQE